MVRFRCRNCGYKFVPKDNAKSEPPKICPYCNRRDVVEKERTANELLNDLTGSDD